MKLVSSVHFKVCIRDIHTKKQAKTLIRALNEYNVKIKHNYQKMVTLESKVKDTCDPKTHLSLQNDCEALYLEIIDITDENRRLNILKRDLFLQNGIDWDEEYS